MQQIAKIVVVVAVVSLVAGIVSRITMIPVPVAPGGLEANVLLKFTNTCLLLAIVLLLIKK